MWASTMVQKPRAKPIATNRSSSDRPVITSGIDQRRVDHAGEERAAPEAAVADQRDRRRACRAPSPTVAERSATRSVTQAASSSASFWKSATYHSVEKPPHTVTSFEALNE